MPTGYPRTECVVCGRPPVEVGTLSTRGKCRACANRRIAENYISMKTRTGPYFKLWRSRMAASVGATLDTGQQNE